MKKVYVFAALIVCFLIAALPAFAGSRSYANDLLDEWMAYADEQGYEVFYSNVDRIDTDNSVSYYYDLEPGNYYFVAEGGEDTEDLDMYVYDEDGNEIVSDELDDNYPMCEVLVNESTSIEVEVIAYSFSGHEDSDYFCFVAAIEPGNAAPDTNASDTDEIIDYWTNWAEDSDYNVIYTDSGELGVDDSDTYDFELDSGHYYIYAESLEDADDIDMFVYGSDGEVIISDELSDNYPICEFDLRRADEVQIKISSYDIAHGRSTEYGLVIATTEDGAILNQGSDVEIQDRPLTDQTDREYVDGLRGSYMEMVDDENYEMIFDEIRLLQDGEPYTMRITLGSGDYIVYAEGGLRIADLDLRVSDGDGYVVAEDTQNDSNPVCEFSTRDSATYEIEIDPYDMVSGWSEGYYVIVIVRD
ncbi:MAG: hypothetical protein NTY09_11170 [bacterium]|nr:hypothetical protein [bacterium]